MPQDLYNLPQGWEWRAIKDVVEKTANLTPASEPNLKWTYVDISSIDRKTHQITEPKLIAGKDVPSRAKKHIQKNDILFATTRPNLKNIAVFEGGVDSPVASTGFCVLRSGKRLNHKFLFYFSITEELQNQIAPYISGASYPAITDNNLKKVQIPIPPLGEQERIVEKLDALFRRIDDASNRLNQILTHTQALFASALDQVYAAENNRFQIGEIAAVKGGKRLPKGKKLQDEETAHPYIRVSDFTENGTIKTDNLKFITDDIYEQIQRYTISSKDLYISIAGTIGKTGVIPEELDGANLTENAAKLVFNEEDRQDVRYVYYFTQSNDFMGQTGLATKIVAQPKLALTRLSKIEIPLPSVEEQHRIVEHLDGLSDRIQTLEKTTCARINHLAALKASLLNSAFRGEL